MVNRKTAIQETGFRKGQAASIDLTFYFQSVSSYYGYCLHSELYEAKQACVMVEDICVPFNLVSPECVTPQRLHNTAVRGGVTNFATFTCLHHANNPNVK